MRAFFLNLRIRVKLLAAFGSLLLLSVFLIVFSTSSTDRILAYKDINQEVDGLMLHLEKLELSTKDFIHEAYKTDQFQKEGTSPGIDVFRAEYAQSREVMQKINDVRISDSDRVLTRGLLGTLDSLAQSFESLVALLKQRGFRDFGSEGTLRTAIHNVENSGFNIDKATLLTLRRHEKDFFLRKDLKYQIEFNTRVADFKKQLQADPTLAALVPSVDQYTTEFNHVVEIEKKIGLKEEDGIRGKLRDQFAYIRPRLESLRARILENNAHEIFRTRTVLWICFGLQIIAGIIMTSIYSSLLTKSIQEIRGAMQSLAAGIFPPQLAVRTREEIGETKAAFNQFVDRLKAATVFAQTMGTGSQQAEYDRRYADDVLATSLIQAQRKLAEADTRQRKINWTNEGIARFNDILKNEEDELNVVADKVLRLSVQILNANQGALYIITGPADDRYLERIATYAYGKKKFESHRVDVGKGLAGQCVLEGSTIFLKELPRDYVRITSGLGEATPRNVIIVPLKIRSDIMGVIEIASFSLFAPHEIEFIERIAENIATLLANKQTAADTKRLLDESQRRANELARQAEEMRQNAEELQATQEEMRRQRRMLEDRIRELELQLESYEVADGASR